MQFQKGMSLVELMSKYGDEDKCREALFKLRWPQGFICPECGSKYYCELKNRRVYQCNRCHYQATLTSGTIFHSSKVALNKWFLTIYLTTQSKNGISSSELSREVGVSQNTAWSMKHKMMQVMLERDDEKRLSETIELDDAYLGGRRSGGKRGRGSEGMSPILIALDEKAEEHPQYMKLSKVIGFQSRELRRWRKHCLAPGSKVITDGLQCFRTLDDLGCIHEIKTDEDKKRLSWVHTMLENVKISIKGTYHAIGIKHAARYLTEFEYRFNRRFKLEDMIARLAYAAVHTPPMPQRFLKLAENSW